MLSLDHNLQQLSPAQGPYGEQENIPHITDEKPTLKSILGTMIRKPLMSLLLQNMQ